MSALAQDNQLAAACQRVYEVSTANISTSKLRSASLETLHDQGCSGSSKKSGYSLDTGMKLAIEAIPFEGNLGLTSSDEKLEYLCKNYESLKAATAALDQYAKTVVGSALANFNGCLELASRGVSVQPSITLPESIVVQISVPDADGITLQAFSASSNMTCNSPQIADRNKKLSADKQYKFENAFSIACQRTKDQAKEGAVFTPGFISFTTSRSKYPFSFSLPEDEHLQPMLASQSHSRIADLEKLADEKAQLATRLEGELAKVQGYALTLKKAGTGHPNPGGLGQMFACYTTIEVMKKVLCEGAARIEVMQTLNRGGGDCGYNGYVFACLGP